ncbi:hypothetical protein ABT320_07310 [Streptomyces cellulosae]
MPGRPLLNRLYGDAFALTYLAVCAALTVWALAAGTAEHEDASLAGVIPVLATAPVSIAALALPGGAPTFVLAAMLGALVNAAAITWCSRRLRGGKR